MTVHESEAQKSDDQTNSDKVRVAANIIEYHIIIPKHHHFSIHDDEAIILCKNVEINTFKMNVQTFWSQLDSFYIPPN